MDLTQGTVQQKNARAKKMMLLFLMVALTMSFAAWTSAYIVSSSRPDWLSEFALPNIFFISTGVLLMSSITFHLVKTAIKANKRGLASILLLLTLMLGITFIRLQFVGFQEIIDAGYYFTGPGSSITMSYVYVITAVHIVHVIAGLIVLLVVTINHFRGKYKPGQTLGLELGVMFWHFLDVLWVYLFLFLYFFR
ncbi:heme-copper oxidase subunit III [Sungkyunkwania multivorans]|uniref:Heme-copper oxidase subunit III n=1 Tax=Sungkyunkwania multivorans TaxID=1173618 RepID=A0ABW3CT94_9FLAO